MPMKETLKTLGYLVTVKKKKEKKIVGNKFCNKLLAANVYFHCFLVFAW